MKIPLTQHFDKVQSVSSISLKRMSLEYFYILHMYAYVLTAVDQIWRYSYKLVCKAQQQNPLVLASCSVKSMVQSCIWISCQLGFSEILF